MLSLSLLFFVSSVLVKLGGFRFAPLFTTFGLCVCILVTWFGNIVAEGTYLGYHTKRVVSGLRLSIVLFILSECFFFLSFF